VAFLLAQLGAHAASAFAERLVPLELRPPEVGVLSRLARSPGESQRALADALGMHAPRLVALIDDLEARGLVERRRDPSDRRLNALHVTGGGRDVLKRATAVLLAASEDLTRPIGEAGDRELRSLLRKLLGI
jgi:DNA-binding MarR family transcriptional regulator